MDIDKINDELKKIKIKLDERQNQFPLAQKMWDAAIDIIKAANPHIEIDPVYEHIFWLGFETGLMTERDNNVKQD